MTSGPFAQRIDDVFLEVNGRRYSGWKSMRVTRSIESLAGSFSLEVSDRWGESKPWPIVEGDECRVLIGTEVVIDGYVDKRSLGISADARTLGYSGRDRAEDLVDCSLLVSDASTKGNKWTYRNVDLVQFAKAIATPHGIPVSMQKELVGKLKKSSTLVAHPGETGFEAIKRVAASAGVLVISDGAGGILITGAGTERAARLVEGVNFTDAQVEFDATERYFEYLVSSQPPGTDDASGEATRVQASATDVDVRRKNRRLLIRPDKGYDAAAALRRAGWEARVRAARSASPTISVVGWQQPSGRLWPINAITRVVAPNSLGIDGDLVISQVEFTAGDGGRTTQLRLVRPDVFIPEPQNSPSSKVSGEGRWNELATGAL